MAYDPYRPPRSALEAGTSARDVKYANYAEVPFYLKQWFFWLMYFTIPPIAIAVLLFGDVYYQRRGRVRSFGLGNRIVAGFFFFAFVLSVLAVFTE